MVEILSDLKNYPSWLQFIVAVWVVLTATIILAWFIIKPLKNNPLPTPPPSLSLSFDDSSFLPKPTPNDIFSSSKGIPMLETESSFKKFIGMRIRWELIISSLNYGYKSDSEIIVYMQSKEFQRGLISCTVQIKDYPALKILKENTPVEIIGVIKDVENYRVKIDPAKLKIQIN